MKEGLLTIKFSNNDYYNFDFIGGLMNSNDIIALATVGLLLVGIVGLYLKFEPPRSKDARKRARLIHEKLLERLMLLEDLVEKIQYPHCGKRNNTIYSWNNFNLKEIDNEDCSKLLINKKTKDELLELREKVKKYGDIGGIVVKIIPSIIEQNINKYLKNTNTVLIESNPGLYINGNEYNNLLNIFSDYFEYEILKTVVLEDADLDRVWLENIKPDVYSEINGAIIHPESLGMFLKELNKDLKSNSSIRMLRESIEIVLLKIEEFKKLLESEKKKLTSHYGFVYGSGNKNLLEKMEDSY